MVAWCETTKNIIINSTLEIRWILTSTSRLGTNCCPYLISTFQGEIRKATFFSLALETGCNPIKYKYCLYRGLNLSFLFKSNSVLKLKKYTTKEFTRITYSSSDYVSFIGIASCSHAITPTFYKQLFCQKILTHTLVQKKCA